MQLKLFKSQDLDLKELEFLFKDQSDFHVLEKLLSSTAAFKIAQVLDSRDKYNNEASRIINTISRKDQTIFNERGVNDLYIGWPFVEGQMIDGTPIRCPLLFISVELEQQNNFWYLKRKKNAPISLNRSFLLAYSFYNKVSFSDDFLETNLEDFSKDSISFRNELYQFLKNSNLEINFNREIFEDQVKSFQTYKRKEYEDQTRTGELILRPNAVLGIYPQAGSYLVPDYEKLIANINEEKSFEDFFVERDVTEFEANAGHELYTKQRFINKVKEEKTFTPFKYDASQENALKAVKMGKSIVVQGPPGTGKSQLISNLVADFISRGKRVLVVCQKKVALQVVSQRLSEKNLDDFTVLLHDFKNDRKSIFSQIENQIDKLEEYENENNRLDTIYQDRDFLKVSREIDNIQQELEEFKFALYDATECGIPIKELYLNSNPKGGRIDLKTFYGKYERRNLDIFLKKIDQIYPYRIKLGKPHYPFRRRKSFKDFTSADQQKMLSLLDEMHTYQRDFRNKISVYLTDPITLEDSGWILDREEQIHQILGLFSNQKAFENFKYLFRKHPDEEWLTVKEKLIDNCFKDGFEKTVENNNLGKFRELLQICTEAQKNFWKRWTYRIFSRDAVLIRQTFESNELSWNKEGIKKLNELFLNRLNFQHHVSEMSEKDWLMNVPESKNKEVFDRWFENNFEALEAFKIASELRSFTEYWNLQTLEYAELKEKLLGVLEICREANAKYKEWQNYLLDSQLEHLLIQKGDIEIYKNAIADDFDDLCALDKLKDGFTEDETKIVSVLFDEKEGATKDELQELFKNSIYLHWIDHIETKYPILRDVSSLEMESREKRIREAVKEKRRLSSNIVLQQVRENTYKDVDYNRLGNRTTYRDLHHQVSKKRRLWPIRKVIQEFEEEIYNLVPCWLASPEAVSAVFPLDQKFDLVIFDEASQCFVEKSIPAIHRAKQVVITGDSHQLSPYDLYQVRYEDDKEGDKNPLLEIDSLLDVSAQFLMEVYLTGHYRSKSVDLIRFSNENFYKGKLRMIPYLEDFVKHEKGFDYQLVEGTWSNNVNEEEANHVAQLCLDYFKTKSDKKIGVVTFNFKQQQLILDKVYDLCREEEIAISDQFFVKNIENVQGDERDVIIFSLAYAPNQQGKLQMNFGSLNQKGGPNRLNVAITRAKEKNIIVASILPHQMQVDEAKNEGPRLLRDFLAYAHGVSNDTVGNQQKDSKENNLHWLLKDKIADQILEHHNGYDVEKDYHFADILSSNQGEIDLFLTDDDLYFQSDGVKYMHVYTPLILKQRGWKFSQQYSRNYWQKQTIRLPHKYQVDHK